jgi:hypothetical protein
MFWIGIVAAGIALLVNFVLTKRTFVVRLVLLTLGLVGVTVTAYKYLDDQQRMAPRHLSDKQVVRVVAGLKQFSGQKFQMITYPKCDECSNTFILIYNLLIQAQWVRDGPPVGIPIGAMQSVLINVSNNADARTKQAADVLATALNREGIAAKLDGDSGNSAVVDIVIGLKP